MEFPRLPLSGKRGKLPGFKWSSWYLTALKLAVGLLLVLLLALFWLLNQSETEEQRGTLIADVLWLEQRVNFHLEVNSGQLQQLANDIAQSTTPSDVFRLRSHYLMKNNPDIQRILWLDTRIQLRDAMPTSGGDVSEFRDTQRQAIDMARKLGKTAYSEAYRIGDAGQFEMFSPVFEDGEYRGTLVSVYSLSALLKSLVPWWFADKYRVSIRDGNGRVLATKASSEEHATDISYARPLDPPGLGTELEVSAYRGKGNLAQLLITASIVFLASAMLFSLWIMRGHIKRRLAAEQALRSEHAFRKAMEDSLTIGMRARNREGLITYANPAFCQMVGYSEEELIQARPPMPYWAPENLEAAQAFHNAVVDGVAPREGVELRFMHKDGHRFDALIYEAPLIDADGQQTGWMASIVDVTARNQAEELARQQQEKLQLTSRLITMGEMASTLAHELNQPLAAIASYNSGCLNRLAAGPIDPAELTTVLEKLGVQAQRAGKIIRRVHEFVRKSEPKLVVCDLAEVINDSIGFIEADARLHNVRIQRDLDGGLPQLKADRVMLEQVLLNLMRNGIEAMNLTPPDRRLLIIRLRQVASNLEIQVVAHGSGLPSAVQEKLFSPFFSTKLEGMGMGLNICRSIVEFHHGRLSVETNPAGGAIFIVSLPAPHVAKENAKPLTPSTSDATRSEV